MKKTIKSLMLLSAALLLNSLCVNAQWILTGNPTATNTSILGATGTNISLRLFAGGSAATNERIHITGSTGNVGIGTTSPTTKLHVVGTTRLQGVTTIIGATTITGAATVSGLTTTGTLKVTGGAPGLNKILRSDAAGLASWITNPVGTNTNNKVPRWNGTQLVAGTIFDNATNVGIGVSPLAPLDVLSQGNYDVFTTKGDLRIGDATHSLRMGVALAGGGAGDAYISSVGGTSRLFLGSGGTFAGTQMMAITGTGVGIGTVAPAFKLHVAGTGYTAACVDGGAGSEAWNYYQLNGVFKCATGYRTSSDQYCIFAASGDRIVVNNSNGNVGINNPTPAFKLDVGGRMAIRDGGSGSSAGAWFFNTANTGAPAFIGLANDNTVGMYGNNGVGWSLVMDCTNGNVGIGAFPSGYKLDICGTARAKEVRVESGWCDYVFAKDYKLPALSDVEAYINTNKHLPDVTAGSVIESEGLEVGKVSSQMIKKIEELTLYVINQEKAINELKAQNAKLESRMNSMIENGGK